MFVDTDVGDVLDDMAERVLKAGGQVYVLAPDQMPSLNGVAVVYRFSATVVFRPPRRRPPARTGFPPRRSRRPIQSPETPARALRSTAMRKPATNVSDREIGDLVAVLRLLADDVRVRILLLLAGYGEMTVGRLSAELSRRQPLVSHHLGLMRSGSLVCSRRDGRNVYYSLAEAVDGFVGVRRSVCIVATAGRCVRVCPAAAAAAAAPPAPAPAGGAWRASAGPAPRFTGGHGPVGGRPAAPGRV